MSFWKWSKTPANNGTADPSCPFPEGMAPSAVNDGTRGMMAALAKYRDDISGKLITSGTSTAYTISSNQSFDTLAHMDGAIVGFVPHVDSGDAPTLNVDGLGAKPLRGQSGVDLAAGILKAGTPHVAFYSNSTNEFVLHSYLVIKAEIPVGGGCDYWGSVVPSDDFVFPYGQAISRPSFPICFARLGTTYGSGDGSNTFNLPDKRGRVTAGLDTMGGTSADRLNPSMTSGVLGSVGGGQTHQLTPPQLPVHRHTNTLSDPGHTHAAYGYVGTGVGLRGDGQEAFNIPWYPAPNQVFAATTGVTINNADAGSGSAHPNIQPTIVCNYILRVK